jgi:hypothetical protein
VSNVASRLRRSQGRDVIRAEYDSGGSGITVHGNKQPQAGVKSTPAPNSIEMAAASGGAGITAAVTNPKPAHQQASTSATKFLESVLVWPGSAQAPGWINLHVNAKNTEPAKNGGKPWVVGWPFKTIDDTVDRINWVSSTDTFFNVWVCMSQQSECAKKANEKLKAVRKAANATWLKAIWIDCDVKPGDPKHYHTMSEAFDALDAFRDKVGLPFPSMIVNSGGGLHVYWISDTPMSPDEWRPYADGLKACPFRAMNRHGQLLFDQFSGAVGADPTRLVWCDLNAVEACGFDSPFHDADPLRLADDLRNFSLSFR